MHRRTFHHLALAQVAGLALPIQAQMTPPDGVALRLAAARGQTTLDWLDSRHTFSFGNYEDGAQQGFSDLRVLNEDRVAPGKGFATHSHQHMEIFTYVLEGVLEHRDSLGHGSVIRPGDLQLMSAGDLVQHSEFNPSGEQAVHFLQIWLVPDRAWPESGYQQTRLNRATLRGRLMPVVSPRGEGGALHLRQSATVYAGQFHGTESATLGLQHERHAYVHVARGSLRVNGVGLRAGDGVRIRGNAPVVRLTDGQDAEVLVFDLRAHGAVA